MDTFRVCFTPFIIFLQRRPRCLPGQASTRQCLKRGGHTVNRYRIDIYHLNTMMVSILGYYSGYYITKQQKLANCIDWNWCNELYKGTEEG